MQDIKASTRQRRRAAPLAARFERFTLQLEKLRLGEYVTYLSSLKRIWWTQFISGLARGLGMALGFTVLGALVIALLQQFVGVPVIGEYIASLVRMVQEKLR